MASAYKPKYLRTIPENAERCRLKGKAAVRYVDGRGKKHVRLIHRDPRGKLTGKMVCEQGRWWLKWTLPDGTVRREKGFRDKLATEAEANRREREAQLARAGVLTVDEAHLSAPLREHIDAYVGDLERAGRTPNYYELVASRLKAMTNGCGWDTLRAITPDSLTGFLVGLQRRGYKPKTLNEYTSAAKGFCRWCIQTRRLAGNPLEAVTKTASDRDGGNDKAALTREQAEALLAVSTRHRLLYLVALRTGLRRLELKTLQWGDVVFGGPRPHIQLRATATKARRADTVPLRADVAGELRRARPADARPGDRVFASLPRMHTFRADLDRAGIPHVDERGKPVVFHSLRVTFGTWLAQTVKEPRVHMELMRHTDMRLTMQYYTDPRLLDTARAVDNLPDLDTKGQRQAAVERRTGTDDMPVAGPEKSIAQKYVPDCPERSTKVRGGVRNDRKTPENRGLSMEAPGIEPGSRDGSVQASTCVVPVLFLAGETRMGHGFRRPGRPYLPTG